MDAIRIKNFRCFQDTGLVKIQPLTVLLGVNSSGKSSFLRSLLLLRQSIETKTKSPILWYGNRVDFGSFNTCISRFADSESITFHFESKALIDTGRRLSYRYPQFVEKEIPYSAKFEISEEEYDRSTYISKAELRVFDHDITINLSDYSLESIKVGKKLFTEKELETFYVDRQKIVPELFYLPSKKETRITPRWYEYGRIEYLIPIIRLYAHGRTSDYTIYEILKKIRVGPSEDMLIDMRENKSATSTFLYQTQSWNVNSAGFRYTRDNILLSALPNILDIISEDIESFVTSTLSIAPIRAIAERYYRFQDLTVDELDSTGRNLAVYLNNLNSSELDSFREWTKHHFGFLLSTKIEGGHIHVSMEDIKDNYETNLSDRGFGFSQLIPILVQLWGIINRKRPREKHRSGPDRYTLLIEQPELHLHPSLQRKLTDILLLTIEEANRNEIDLNVILETHSESIVNRIGECIELRKFSKDKTQVLLFEQKSEYEAITIRRSEYNDAGHLVDWPYGFFHK